MNLIQSICCFFSSRCAGGAVEPKKTDQDDYVETRDAGTAPPPPRPGTPETEDSLRSRPLNLPAAGIAASKRAISGRHVICAVQMSSGSARPRTALRQPYQPATTGDAF